jgi:hypothetical protein
LSEEIIIIEICEKFGWDYYQFLQQPIWFIELIIEKNKAEARELKRREKNS